VLSLFLGEPESAFEELDLILSGWLLAHFLVEVCKFGGTQFAQLVNIYNRGLGRALFVLQVDFFLADSDFSESIKDCLVVLVHGHLGIFEDGGVFAI